ncbi:hypothetical protein F4823DRAFT_199523 [Ustulina deusta]|nr:hypothetical protein F4823DRAFT_199523 [Ustulina deusta]
MYVSLPRPPSPPTTPFSLLHSPSPSSLTRRPYLRSHMRPTLHDPLSSFYTLAHLHTCPSHTYIFTYIHTPTTSAHTRCAHPTFADLWRPGNWRRLADPIIPIPASDPNPIRLPCATRCIQPYSLIAHYNASVFRVLVLCSHGLACPVASCPPHPAPSSHPSVMARYHLPTLGCHCCSHCSYCYLLPTVTAPAAGAVLDGWPPMQMCRDVMSHIMHGGAAALPLLLL